MPTTANPLDSAAAPTVSTNTGAATQVKQTADPAGTPVGSATGGAAQNAPQYATLGSAASSTPTTWNNTADQTVAGQVQGLIAANSPLMQQAVTMANQQSNARGLLNSSIGVGAAQHALYQAALPIAQSDAAQASRVAGYNVDTTNQALARADAANNQIAAQNAAAFNASQSQGFDTNTKLALADIEASYKTLMQTDASVGQLYQQVVKNISDIMVNKDLDKDAKQTSINQQISLLTQGMHTFGGLNNLDLGNLLDFSGVPPVETPTTPTTPPIGSSGNPASTANGWLDYVGGSVFNSGWAAA